MQSPLEASPPSAYYSPGRKPQHLTHGEPMNVTHTTSLTGDPAYRSSFLSDNFASDFGILEWSEQVLEFRTPSIPMRITSALHYGVLEPSPERDASSDSPMKLDMGSPSRHPEEHVFRKPKAVKMHECEICHKRFPRPSGLRTHMNTHNNVKPFQCEFQDCSRSFTVQSNARRHLRTHGVMQSYKHPRSQGSYDVHFNPPVVLPDNESCHIPPLEWVLPKPL